MIEKKIVKGIPRHGHFLGHVEKDSMFGNKGVVRHGWVELADGTVCDPTRWVFENAAPYIFFGPADEYDIGGDRLREAFLQPCPEYDEDGFENDPFNQNPIEPDLFEFLCEQAGNGAPFSKAQVFWFSNMPMSMLGIMAKPLFEHLVEAGHGVFIPTDNYHLILGEKHDDVKKTRRTKSRS